MSSRAASPLTCAKRSPASSHLELCEPNQPTVDEAFFSALARCSSALDLPMVSSRVVLGLSLGVQSLWVAGDVRGWESYEVRGGLTSAWSC